VHVTVCPDAEQPWLDPAATNDWPAGSTSTTTVGAAAGSGPAFDTINEYVTSCPCNTVDGDADFTNDRSAAGRTSTDAESELFPTTGSPVDDDTDAESNCPFPATFVFATTCTATGDPTITLPAIGQVTTCPDAPQVALDPAATNDWPAGNVSTTTGAAAESGPAFETVNVYVTFCPCNTLDDDADLRKDRSAAGTTSTDADATLLSGTVSGVVDDTDA
jgi:hypothetical protein